MQKQYGRLNDSQWQYIVPFLKNHKPKSLCLREVVNAILWITCTGTQWRNLDSGFPKCESVYYYFRLWKKNGVFDSILDTLVKEERKR